MKTTIDNKEVPDRCWYYLLDFNDRDVFETLYDMFDKKRLSDLTNEEFWKFFEFATKNEFETKGEYFNIKDERVDEYKLSFCEVCFQMTNHLNGECQKHKNK